MRVQQGGNFSYAFTKRAKYRIPERGGLLAIDEDTTFVGSNFMQEKPHTPVFDVAPGVALILEDCNLVNATVPDGAIVRGGNLAHILPTKVDAPVLREDGFPVKDTVNLLCDCDKCISATVVLRERIANRTVPKDAKGRIVHHMMKDEMRARRPVKDSERAARAKENEDALALYTRDEAETQGWFAAAWSKVKSLFGVA